MIYCLLENNIERVERECRDVKHNARLAAENNETDIQLLKKKLAHERELRLIRFPLTNFSVDSGCPSPEPRGKRVGKIT